jgi:hypothetical protein
MELQVPTLQSIGGLVGNQTRAAPIASGKFYGERLSGTVEPGGLDWQRLRSNAAVEIEARVVLRSEGGELIGMEYRGLRYADAEVTDLLTKGEIVPPARYYFRVFCSFSTSADSFQWLNQALAIGIGARLPSGPVYDIYELL